MGGTPDDGEQRSRATGIVCGTHHVAHLEGSGPDPERRTVNALPLASHGTGPRVYWLGKASPRYCVDDIVEWLERVAA